MVFSSTEFLFIFLPVVFLLYYSLPRKTHNVLLLSASLIFYAWGEPVFIGVMLLSVLVNYGLALGIGPAHEPDRDPDPVVRPVALLCLAALQPARDLAQHSAGDDPARYMV